MGYVNLAEETLQKQQSFQSVDDMNEAVKGYKEAIELSARDKAIIDAISRYACKYIGVCYLSKGKIANEAGFASRRTAIRACHRLEELGVIKQYETRRVSGDKRQSVNIIVIQPFVLEEKNKKDLTESQGEVTARSHGKETLPKTSLQTNTYKETFQETDALLKRGLKTAIPEKIFNAFSPFFDAKQIYEMYGVLLRAKKSAQFMLEDYADEYVDHFFNVMRLYKQGKVQNLEKYLYVTWERVTRQISRKSCTRYGAVFQAFGGVK